MAIIMRYDFLTLRHIRWSKNMYFWQNTFCSKNSNKIETFEELVLTRMFDWFEHLFLLSWQPLSRRNNWISKVEPLWNSPRLSLVHPCFSSTIELGLLVAMTLALWTAFSWTLGELRERKYQKLGLYWFPFQMFNTFVTDILQIQWTPALAKAAIAKTPALGKYFVEFLVISLHKNSRISAKPRNSAAKGMPPIFTLMWEFTVLSVKKQRTKQPLTIPFYFMKSPSLKPKNVVTNWLSGFFHRLN